jgi:hypothetical protein
MGHTLHHQGLNLDAELLHAERTLDSAREREAGGTGEPSGEGERS